MAIRNTAAVYINGVNLTAFVVQPIKWGNLLDERLDEMYLSLRHCPFENFKPLTPVEIHYTNQLYFGSTNVGAPETLVKRYLIADDANAAENPVGKGLYDHDLYIIELTKILECVVEDTNTITNVMGRVYTENAQPVFPTLTNEYYIPNTPSNYVSPLPVGNFSFVSAHTIFTYVYYPVTPGGSYLNDYFQTVTDQNGNQLFYNHYSITTNFLGIVSTSGDDIGCTLSLQSGITYTVEYRIRAYNIIGGTSGYYTTTATYEFVISENQFPLKKWTITDVINRLLDIAEPIRQGETPRFRLQGMNTDGTYQAGSQAAKFDTVLAPQFSFTKSTLRECLQQIGGVIHGETRADIAQDSGGTYYYEISFDLYGQTEKSGIWSKKYISKTVSQVVDSYASHLDSNAENLVNQLDKYSGVIVEPYDGGYKNVRTETMYARITDANMLIQTQFPIYSVEKVECGYIVDNLADAYPPIDITPYVFESSIYNTRLSSYSSDYPYSKAFGIMYTQGQKNLTMLNFKPEHPISSVFENYAIINILSRATGQDISIAINTRNNNNYPTLAFRVTYTPFYTARVGQTKQNYLDYPIGAGLIYNQQANVIESRYYGENLKGTIARIGNIEKSITYNLARLSEIPAAGQMFDDDYYISAVSVEFLPTMIKCTIGLSKDFNRLSQYIGISSVKRFSEVSQGQAVERNTLWREYIVVGDSIAADSACRVGDNFMNSIRYTFSPSAFSRLTNVKAWGLSYAGNPLPAVSLPLISSAFGNSVSFSWEYEDNYSAGAISQYQQNGVGPTDVQGYFQNNYQYTDYYGRMYWYVFDLAPQGIVPERYVNTDISGQVETEIAEDGTSVTFTFPNPNGYRVTLSVTVYEQVGSSSIPFPYTQQTTGTSLTFGQRQGGTITSATVNSAVERAPNFDAQNALGLRLPQLLDSEKPTASSGYVSTVGQQPYLLRKDNREKLQCNFQIDFVTNRKGLIIGSALAAYNPCVRGSDSSLQARLYVFDEPINKFVDHVEGHVNVDLSTMQYVTVTVSSVSNGQFYVSAPDFTTAGKAWAIVTRQNEQSEAVEDDRGNVISQTVQYGGDVLLAQNMDISAGDSFTPIYFTKKREVFDKTVWKTLR